MPPSIVIIEDELGVAAAIEAFLERQGLVAKAFAAAEPALAALETLAPDLALVDIHLPGMDGLTALDAIRRDWPETSVIVMTAFSTVSSAVAAMKAGAVDYLTKPVDLDELWVVIQRTWETQRVRGELAYLRRRAGHAAPIDSLVGKAPVMDELRQRIRKVATLDRLRDTGPTVLITGDTGTGKQLAARAIHAAGPRATGPFVEINCAAIPASLLEAELFGYEKGAYTDARASKAGLFEAADGGTLFLDEIGLLDVALQAKLLKVIDDRAVRRLGSLTSRRLDVRLLAATNRNLETAVREDAFRQDLLYRLQVLTIELPPLRARHGDISLLAQHFLEQVCHRYALGDVRFSPLAIRALEAYAWPGNVRELANVVERAALLNPGCTLEPEHLALTRGTGRSVSVGGEHVQVDFGRGPIDLEAVERALIRGALEHVRWNRSRAAELLGLTKETLRYRIEKYALGPQS